MNHNGATNNERTKYQPQLRSKTPTTDRLLFQHTLASSTSNNNTTNNNGSNGDYIFLNENQNQQKNFNELYSTVNKSAKIEQQPIETTTNGQKIIHVPIYDSTTNLQHQRVQQNLNKFNNHSHASNHAQQHQQSMYAQQQQQLNGISNRSKTPGPDIIYFHNKGGNNDAGFGN